MDKQIDIEKLRSRLAQMSRAEVRALAINAGLKPSTVEKFRLKHIEEPRISKLQKLSEALGKLPKVAAAPAGASAKNADRDNTHKEGR